MATPASRSSGPGLKVQRARTNLRGESLAVKGARAYNMLPTELKAHPMPGFKKGVKDWVIREIPVKPP